MEEDEHSTYKDMAQKLRNRGRENLLQMCFCRVKKGEDTNGKKRIRECQTKIKGQKIDDQYCNNPIYFLKSGEGGV